LENVEIRYGGQNQSPALDLYDGGSAVLRRVKITDSRGHGLQINYGSPEVSDGEFSSNALSGVRVVGAASPLIENSVLAGNAEMGLYSESLSTVTIRQSSIQENVSYGVYSGGGNRVQAQNNWWGDPSGPQHPVLNPGGLGNAASDGVDFNPWLGSTQVTRPSLEIQEGDLTASPTIHLLLSAAGAVSMRVSERSDLAVPAEPFASEKIWLLSAGDGLKTVYAQFYAADGSPSAVVSDAINLQASPPSAEILLQPPSPLKAGSVQVALTASEKLSEASLSFTPEGRPGIPVPLTSVDSIAFHGTIVVSTETGDGAALFQFSGTDLHGAVGTAITAGADFIIDTTPPGAPSLMAAAPQSGRRVHLTWEAPGGEPAAAYNLYRATNAFSSSAGLSPVQTGLSGPAFTDQAPADGPYHYAVSALDALGNESEISNRLSAEADGTPPQAPSLLSARREGSAVELSWRAPEGEPPALYNVYRAAGRPPDGGASQRVARTTSTAHTDALSASGDYYYAVAAEDGLGNESGLSDVPPPVHYDITPPRVDMLQLTPPAPVGIGVLTLRLVFSEPLSAAPVVELTPEGAPQSTAVSSVSFSSATWAGNVHISSATPQGQAQLRVSGAADLFQNVMTAETHHFLIDFEPPAPPRNLAQRLIPGSVEIELAWEAPEGESSLLYNLYQASHPFVSRQGLVPVKTGISALSARHIPPVDGEARHYAVSAVDAAANEGETSNTAFVSVPLSPFVQSPNDNAVANRSPFPVSGLAQPGALVEIYSGAGNFLAGAAADAQARFTVLVPLVAGPNALKALAVGPSGRKSPETGLITVHLDDVPQPPAGLSYSALDTQIRLSWTPSPDPDVTGYNVYRDGHARPLNFELIPQSPGTLLFQDIGLTNGRLYSYAVSALDAAGQESPRSQPVQAAPLAGPRWGGSQ
ncbi:MAG: right-handed parallel beta-helix repeat-containing protein, partial [Elusimicrobiota bacterium]